MNMRFLLAILPIATTSAQSFAESNPSNNAVEACIHQIIKEPISDSGGYCSDYSEIESIKLLGYRESGSENLYRFEMKTKITVENLGYSSTVASKCGFWVPKDFGDFNMGDVVTSTNTITLEKWSDGWTCGRLSTLSTSIEISERPDPKAEQAYNLTIVSRDGERSGVYRVIDGDETSRRYYIIVEAMDKNGKALSLPIRNEESGKTETVSVWAVRVPESTFNAIREDKLDDGILQNKILGTKRRGEFDVEYFMPTEGGTITSW